MGMVSLRPPEMIPDVQKPFSLRSHPAAWGLLISLTFKARLIVCT